MKLKHNKKPSFAPKKAKPSFKEILESIGLMFAIMQGIEWLINYIIDKLS